MELFLLLDVLLLQILLSPPLSTFSSPLGNCNCATFNLEQYNQLRLHGNLSREPFTNRSDMGDKERQITSFLGFSKTKTLLTSFLLSLL